MYPFPDAVDRHDPERAILDNQSCRSRWDPQRMWATVVLMALVAGRGPARIAAVIVISSKSRPVRLWLPIWLAASA